MQIGRFEVSYFNFGFFSLDGGSMFGSVPKNLWSKRIPADEQNRIRLAARSLVLKEGSRTFLVDCGMGDKWPEKQRDIYAIENTPRAEWPFDPADITDLVLTHLHFDHAGGASSSGAGNELTLTFPNATIFLQAANLENARNPTLKERASYLPENIEPLMTDRLVLVDGDVEIYPGIAVHRADGHTRGQQWIEVKDSERPLFYLTDLVPTSRHLPLPFHMGYDRCAESLMDEKAAVLTRAEREGAIVFFEHDPDTAAGTVMIDERGHFALKEKIEIPVEARRT